MNDRDKWLGVACACLAVLLYVNTLNHGYALDDYPTIYGNRLTTAGVRGIPTMLHTGYWYGLDGLNDWLYRPLSLVRVRARGHRTRSLETIWRRAQPAAPTNLEWWRSN